MPERGRKGTLYGFLLERVSPLNRGEAPAQPFSDQLAPGKGSPALPVTPVPIKRVRCLNRIHCALHRKAAL